MSTPAPAAETRAQRRLQAAGAEPSRSRLAVLRSVGHRLGWGVADQAVSSLSNFALGLYVAATYDPRAFGAFALAYLTYSVVLNGSRGLSSDPLLVRHSGAGPARWRAAAAASAGTALVVGVVVGLVAVLVGLVLPEPLDGVFVALGVVLPGLLLQDSWRFAFFAVGRGRSAFVNDLLWTGLLVAAILAMHETRLPVAWTVIAFGGTAGMAGVVGALQARVLPRPGAVRTWLSDHRALTWRYLVENVSISGASQLRAVALGAVAGLVAVGWVRGAEMLMGPFLVVLMGVAQVAVPEASRVLRRSPTSLLRFCLLLALAQVAAAAAWASAVALVLDRGLGERLLHGLWGPAYALLLPVALTYAVMSFSTAAAAGVRATGLARYSVRAQLFAAALFLVGGVSGAVVGGAAGAVWGGMAATVVAATVWWATLRVAVNRWRASETGSARTTDAVQGPPRGRDGTQSAPSPGPVVRTLTRVGVHLVHLVSSLCGDDWLGRRIRVGVLRLSGASLGPGVTVHGGGYISRPSRLRMGAGSFINRNCYLDLEGPLTIGRRVTVGHGTTFITTVHELGPSEQRCGPYRGAPIEVGDGAWLGANVTVMGGVRIGAAAVVAAGSVVTTDVSPDVVVAGVPARPLRDLSVATPDDIGAIGGPGAPVATTED